MDAANEEQVRNIVREELEPLSDDIRRVRENVDRILEVIVSLQSELREVPGNIERLESDVEELDRER